RFGLSSTAFIELDPISSPTTLRFFLLNILSPGKAKDYGVQGQTLHGTGKLVFFRSQPQGAKEQGADVRGGQNRTEGSSEGLKFTSVTSHSPAASVEYQRVFLSSIAVEYRRSNIDSSVDAARVGMRAAEDLGFANQDRSWRASSVIFSAANQSNN